MERIRQPGKITTESNKHILTFLPATKSSAIIFDDKKTRHNLVKSSMADGENLPNRTI